MLQLDQAPTAYSRACTWARWQAGTHDQKRRNHTFCCGRGLRVLMKWVSLIAGTLVSGAFCVYAHMPNSSQTLAKLLHLDQQRCGVDLGPPPRGHLDHNVLDQASSNERQ